MNWRPYIVSFVAGSSAPAFILFFLAVWYLFKVRKEAIFNYHRYSVLTPLGLGFMAVLAKSLFLETRLTLKQSYFLVSLVSAFVINVNVSIGDQVYRFKNRSRWYLQYFLILLFHLFVYNIIIYHLDFYLSQSKM